MPPLPYAHPASGAGVSDARRGGGGGQRTDEAVVVALQALARRHRHVEHV
jgi:hypothetical protein